MSANNNNPGRPVFQTQFKPIQPLQPQPTFKQFPAPNAFSPTGSQPPNVNQPAFQNVPSALPPNQPGQPGFAQPQSTGFKAPQFKPAQFKPLTSPPPAAAPHAFPQQPGMLFLVLYSYMHPCIDLFRHWGTFALCPR